MRRFQLLPPQIPCNEEVVMVVCSLGGMRAVEGRPVSSDLLTGREFLEVYMRRQPHYLRHNTIPHKDEEHFHESNDISSSSLDEDNSDEDDEDDEDEEEDSTSELPDLLTTTSSEELETTTTTEEPDTTIMQTTRAERSTTESDWNSQELPSQVVSVRVSSSVVREKPKIYDSRSQEEKKISVSYRVEAKAADSFPSASHTLEKFAKPNGTDYVAAEGHTYQRINIGTDPQNSPVSYETSVSSATSDTSVRFFREPPRFEYRTDGSERQQRNFQDEVFGQRQKPFPKQELYKTESRQILSETERNIQTHDELYRTTPPRPFDKTEAGFVKITQAFGKPQNVYDKLNSELNKQDQIYSKSEHIFNKPQQIYTKEEEFIKAEPDFSKIIAQDDVYGRRKQPFGGRQPYQSDQEINQKDLGTKFESPTQEFGNRQGYTSLHFEKREQERVPSYNKPIQNSFIHQLQPQQPEKVYEQPKVYGTPERVYGEPGKVYGEPEKVYGEPEKVYGEPEKVYGQPEKVYSEPEKVYGEPEKVYGEPEKVYGEPEKVYGVAEQNYEVGEEDSVRTNGRIHGTQPTDDDKNDKHKFGYVVEGSNFRKYRVEEKTNDGFIVGEYGVVSHDDGSLRGVRYTADSNINPRLIYDALVKFLSLK